jgi:hypothetical protein
VRAKLNTIEKMELIKSFIELILLSLPTLSIAALTELQKIQILAVFNEARATTRLPAADMKRLEWDEDIAQELQDYTDDCVNYWTEFSDPLAFLAYRDNARDPVGVAKWRTLRMAPFYDYETGGCTNSTLSRKICRFPSNYENIIFAENEKVGCGMTICGSTKKAFHACAIGYVQLDVIPTRAYLLGPRCSKCPDGFPYCVEGLCSKNETTAQPSKSPVTTKPSAAPSMHNFTIVTIEKKKKHRRRGLLTTLA